jgi:hypothetical protein
MIAAGSAVMVMPVALAMSPSAIVAGIAVGILTVALGVAGTDDQGRGTLSMGAQAVFDRGLALGLLGASVIFGLAGDRAALALFGALGLAIAAVAATTRYTVRPVS